MEMECKCQRSGKNEFFYLSWNDEHLSTYDKLSHVWAVSTNVFLPYWSLQFLGMIVWLLWENQSDARKLSDLCKLPLHLSRSWGLSLCLGEQYLISFPAPKPLTTRMWHVYYSMFVKVCVGHPRCPWPAKSQTDLPLSPLCQLRWNFDQWQRFTPVKSDGYLSDLDMCQIDNLCTDYINSSEMKGKLSGKYVGLCRCTHTHTERFVQE